MKKYKLHIIELDYHHDVLDTLIQLVDPSIFDLTCTTTRSIYDKLSVESQSKIDELNIWHQSVISLEQHVNTQADVKMINTLASNFSFWSKHIDTKTIIRIHNINTWFQPWSSLTLQLNFYDIRKAFTYFIQHQLLKREFYYLTKIKNQAHHFSFLSEATSAYFNATFPAQASKNSFTIPATWALERTHTNADSSIIQITIPGTLEKKRKDFKLILQLIEILNDRPESFRVVFAGRVPKQALNFMKQVKALANEHVEIIYQTTYIPSEEFDSMMRTSTLLYFPLVSKTRFKIFAEYYGKTKISGSENDFIKYGIPALLNDFYPIDSPLIYAFNQDDLKVKFESVLNQINSNPQQIHTDMEAHQLNFNFDSQRKQLTEQLIAFLKKN